MLDGDEEAAGSTTDDDRYDDNFDDYKVCGADSLNVDSDCSSIGGSPVPARKFLRFPPVDDYLERSSPDSTTVTMPPLFNPAFFGNQSPASSVRSAGSIPSPGVSNGGLNLTMERLVT